MKTSNKLLVFLFLAMLAFLGAIHLGLYSQLKKGHIISSIRPTDEWIRPYKGKSPSVVYLEGNINVTLVPSDSFFVEYRQTDAGYISCKPVNEDSVVIRGNGGSFTNAHDAYHFYSDLPWVSVHMGSHTGIRLKGLLALLKGNDRPGSFQAHVTATDTQLWIGESYRTNDTNYPSQYYDSLQIEGKNIDLILHSNAHIRHLAANLDASSEVNDQQAQIETISIHYTPQTKINLTGLNLDKLNKSTR
ncbi:hypothetical protein Q4E93_32465 [Flavitalea sp. BT771]|uniref:hypothetical protein n=1 Tax=Flavitalea sp. BT771 TaxID=3063329 RepID=UPI0026E399F8|nr:hypothetical protein [Flavitalea sp. BT771]MDO6435375.1 hypothetical protein [Flavitalea sp. BT771]MDV6224265.1 hypothetical protein [Flavitalea sp. BT771]